MAAAADFTVLPRFVPSAMPIDEEFRTTTWEGQDLHPHDLNGVPQDVTLKGLL
jgi:hypothetical protein